METFVRCFQAKSSQKWGFPHFWLPPASGTCTVPPSLPMSLTILTARVETKSKLNWLLTQGTNPAGQRGGNFHQLAYGARGCWEWLVANSLERGKCVKYSVFPGFRSVESGIQSEASPSLLTLRDAGSDQATPATPSIFTLIQFPPCTFYISSMEEFFFYPESVLSPGSSSWVLVQICWSL